AVPGFPIDTFYPDLPEAPTMTTPDAESPPPLPSAVSELHISNVAQLKTIFWKEDLYGGLGCIPFAKFLDKSGREQHVALGQEGWDDGAPLLNNFITRMTGGTPPQCQESNRDSRRPRKCPAPCSCSRSRSRSPTSCNYHYEHYQYGHNYEDLSHPSYRYQGWSGADALPFDCPAYYAPLAPAGSLARPR
ncbi:hypothetical protein JCM5296_006961, partial [Sporobolomyces johnsonii]